MPRPIPDNVADVTGFIWYLIPVPDDPVFVQAAWDTFSELGQAWNWGKEGRVPDSDIAAQKWLDAIYEALRVRDMGFPDDILTYIDEVETLLEALQNISRQSPGCCDNIAPIGETHAPPDDYPDTPPATWGGETVADSSDWQELVCGAAHAYVDHLKSMADELHSYVSLGIVAIGSIAGLLALLSGAGILLAVSYGTAASVVSAIVALGSTAIFGDVADDIEAARADIVCAIVHGSNTAMADAVEAAISATAWSAFYQYVDYATARNVMLEGSHGEENLGVNRRTDCDCAPDLGDFVFYGYNTLEAATATQVNSYTYELTATGNNNPSVWIALVSDNCPTGAAGGTLEYDVRFEGSVTGADHQCQTNASAQNYACDVSPIPLQTQNGVSNSVNATDPFDETIHRTIVVSGLPRFLNLRGALSTGATASGSSVKITFQNFTWTPA